MPLKRRSLLRAAGLAGGSLALGVPVGLAARELEDAWSWSSTDREASLVAYWAKLNDRPPLSLDGRAAEPVLPAGCVDGAMERNGYTAAQPNSVLIPLSKAETREEQFRVLQEFAAKELKVNLVWEPGTYMYPTDVQNIYCGLRALSAFPKEMFEAIHEKRPSALTFRFQRDVSERCGDKAGGCIQNSDGSAIIKIDSGPKVTPEVAKIMVHELAHVVEDALLPEIAASIAGLDSWNLQLTDKKTYDRDPSFNPQPEWIAEPYGRVRTETVSTLFEHLAFTDFNSFSAWDQQELTGGGSIRVKKLARLAVALSDTLDQLGPSPRKFEGYLREMFVGNARRMLQPNRSDFSVPVGPEACATSVDLMTRGQVAERFRFHLSNGRTLRGYFQRPGPLGVLPNERHIVFEGGDESPDVRVIHSNGAAGASGVNAFAWQVGGGWPPLDMQVRLRWPDSDAFLKAKGGRGEKITLTEVGASTPALVLN